MLYYIPSDIPYCTPYYIPCYITYQATYHIAYHITYHAILHTMLHTILHTILPVYANARIKGDINSLGTRYNTRPSSSFTLLSYHLRRLVVKVADFYPGTSMAWVRSPDNVFADCRGGKESSAGSFLERMLGNYTPK